MIVQKGLPTTSVEFKKEYPQAFEYFTSKGAISMSFHPGYITLHDNFGWLKYDFQDVQIFNQVING